MKRTRLTDCLMGLYPWLMLITLRTGLAEEREKEMLPPDTKPIPMRDFRPDSPFNGKAPTEQVPVPTDRSGQAGGAGWVETPHSAPLLTEKEKHQYEIYVRKALEQWDTKISRLSQQGRTAGGPDANLKMSVANNLELRRLKIQSDLENLSQSRDPKTWKTLKERITRTLAQMHHELTTLPALAE